MSKKILIGGGVALVALVVAVASMLLFAKVQPTEPEVRAAVEMALPDGAVVDQLTFAVFSDDRSKGRVSVKGTYSLGNDIYSRPTPATELMKILSRSQIFDKDVSQWWSEHANLYPQFNGKLAEFKLLYSKGDSLEFSGEMPYFAIVDGTKIDISGIDYARIDGTAEPEFGYSKDDAANVESLATTIVEWNDRRKAAAAAAEVARVAAQEAAAKEAARIAEIEAAAAVKAAEAKVAADAAAEAARIAAIPPLVQAKGDACGGRYKDLKNCESVVFDRENLKYDAFPDVGFCSAADPISGVEATSMGGGQVRYVPKAIGVRVRFFELKGGETFAGFTCK